jgi:hypothetical protein
MTTLFYFPIVIPANAGIQLNALRRAKLDPDLRQGDESEPSRSTYPIVIPANAGIQLHPLRRSKLDPDLRQGDE